MSKSERKAVQARTEDLVKAGVDRELAKVMAQAELDCGIIKPVVNYND